MQGWGTHIGAPQRLCCFRSWLPRPARPARGTVKAYAQQQVERRVVRLTVAGPPNGQPPRTIEVDDPLSTPAELICTEDIVPVRTPAGITKSEAREQAAIIQAQREEITSLRAALAETQDVMYKGKSAYNEVVQTKDMQIAQLYELAATGVRERAKLRHELSNMQHEMQGTKRQLHAFMASLMQLKSSMDSAGDGDLEHALELLQSSSWSQSLQAAAAAGNPLLAEEDVFMQLVQMQRLSNTLVQDMRQDEELMQQGLEPRSRPASLDSFDLDIEGMEPNTPINKKPISNTISSSSNSSSSNGGTSASNSSGNGSSNGSVSRSGGNSANSGSSSNNGSSSSSGTTPTRNSATPAPTSATPAPTSATPSNSGKGAATQRGTAPANGTAGNGTAAGGATGSGAAANAKNPSAPQGNSSSGSSRWGAMFGGNGTKTPSSSNSNTSAGTNANKDSSSSNANSGSSGSSGTGSSGTGSGSGSSGSISSNKNGSGNSFFKFGGRN